MKKVINFIKSIKKNSGELNSVLFKKSIMIFLPALLMCFIICFLFYNFTIGEAKKYALQSNLTKLKEIQYNFEEKCNSAKNIADILSIDGDISICFSSVTPQNIEKKYNLDIIKKLKNSVLFNNNINSVIIMSEDSNEVCSSKYGFMDKKDLDSAFVQKILNKNETSFYFSYADFDNYPYLLAFVRKFTVNGINCYVIVNLNLEETIENIVAQNPNQFFVVHNDEVMYNRKMIGINLKSSEYDALKNVKFDTLSESTFYNKKILSKVYSEKYGWYYIHFDSYDEYLNSILVQRRRFYIFLMIVLIIVAFIIFKYFYSAIYSMQVINDLLDDNSEDIILVPEIKSVTDKIFKFLQNNKELQEELNAKISEMKKLQIQSSQLQINTHFIFNTLNTIYMQSIDDFNFEHKTTKMLLNTSEYLRFVMDSEHSFVDFDKEIYYSKIYTEILKQRYSKLKSVEWINCEFNKKFKIMKIILQPIIENAVHHGISAVEGDYNGILKINCKFTENMLTISVEDNGIGIEKEKLEELNYRLKNDMLSHNNIGLYNVNRRMKLLYGEKADINIFSVPNVETKVVLKIPIED